MGEDWTPVDRIALVAFVALLAVSIYAYSIPVIRLLAFIMPGIALLISGIVALALKGPTRLNLPFEISEAQLELVQPISVAFQRLLRAELVIGFLGVELAVIASVRDAAFVAVGPLVPLTLVVAVMGTVALFIVRVWRIARG